MSIDEISDSRTASDDLDEDLAVAIRLDEIPDVQPLVERQRFEHERDVGRVQPRERPLERGLVLPCDGALLELVARRVRRVLELRVNQSFDEPVLAHQRRDLGQRVLDVLARLGSVGHLIGAVWHSESVRDVRFGPHLAPANASIAAAAGYGNSAAGIRARMMWILRLRPGAPALRS